MMNWPLFDTGVGLAVAAFAAPMIVKFNFWLYRSTKLIRRTTGVDLLMQSWIDKVRFGCALAALVCMALSLNLV